MTPCIERGQRPALRVAGSGPDQAVTRRWTSQRAHGGVEPEPGKRLGFPLSRPEAGPPEQALCLASPEPAPVDR
jgi:hypothetical protein